MCASYDADVIQSLQEFRLEARKIPTKFYTDFDKQVIISKIDPTKLIKIVADPSGHRIQNSIIV